MANRTVRFGDFEVDLRAGELLKRGDKIKLQEKPFQILEILLEQPGEMVSREEVTKRLWPDDTFVDFERGLNTAIGKLRTALGDSAEKPRYIETVARRGYRFVGTIDGSESAVPAAGKKWSPLLVSIVFVVVAAALVIGLKDRFMVDAPSETIESIAVLPLQNTSRNPEDEYFADGMTDLLIADLSKIGELKVISRTSVMRYKGTDKSLPEVARELGVDAIVEGSALRVGDRVRITAQLIHADTEQHIWSENYERGLRDILLLQSELAKTIADEIRVKLTPQEAVRLASARPVDPEANNAYLRGLFYFHEAINQGYRGDRRAELTERSLKQFRQAIEKEPDYAQAYAGLASSYEWLATFGFPEFYPKAKESALKALDIDETIGEAHATLAFALLNYDWDWARAEKHFRRAVSLGQEGHGYAIYLSAAGRHSEAITMIRRAEGLDPLVLPLKTNVALIYMMARQYKRAIQQGQHVVDLNPDDPRGRAMLGRAYALDGRHQEALAEFQEALELSGSSPTYKTELAWGLAVAGKGAEAERILDELIQEPPQFGMGGGPYNMARLYTALSMPDHAFDWLNKMLDERAGVASFLRVNPDFDDLHSDPRFQDLLRRINYPSDSLPQVKP